MSGSRHDSDMVNKHRLDWTEEATSFPNNNKIDIGDDVWIDDVDTRQEELIQSARILGGVDKPLLCAACPVAGKQLAGPEGGWWQERSGRADWRRARPPGRKQLRSTGPNTLGDRSRKSLRVECMAMLRLECAGFSLQITATAESF